MGNMIEVQVISMVMPQKHYEDVERRLKKLGYNGLQDFFNTMINRELGKRVENFIDMD